MEITKFVHSCLLIEFNNKKILIDPGNFTFDSKSLDIDILKGLDYLIVTHEHPDHMHIPFIKMIIARYPNSVLITNQSSQEILKREGVVATNTTPDFIESSSVAHEKVFGVEVPENTLFKINKILTHPGDSLHILSTTPVLALPVQAPWCSLTQSVELAVSLKPDTVLPIHDWHWSDLAREIFYKRLEGYFAKEGIKFIGLKTGEKIKI